MTRTKILRAQAAMKDRKTVVTDLCEELNITRTSLYRYFSPKGEMREDARAALKK
jgi:AcrR family transcriptional regulator